MLYLCLVNNEKKDNRQSRWLPQKKGKKMKKYGNGRGNSQILSYAITDNSISILLRGGVEYTYTYTSAGAEHVERMKSLAQAGYGLDEYIQRNVRSKYSIST